MISMRTRTHRDATIFVMQIRTRFVLVAALTLVPALALAWTGPTQSPPNGNVAAPINTGSSAQAKSGDLAVLGNLGVGTPNPIFKLDVSGSLRATGAIQADSGVCLGLNCRTTWGFASLGAYYYTTPGYENWAMCSGSTDVMVGAYAHNFAVGGLCAGGGCIQSYKSFLYIYCRALL